MHIVLERAEEKLVSHLKNLVPSRPGEGCLHIRGGALKADTFKELPAVIDRWLADLNGYILVCEDKDIFVFSSSIDLKLFNKFVEKIQVHLEYELPLGTELTAFYDFKINGFGLRELAEARLERKLMRAESEKEKAAALARERKKENILHAQLNQDLVKTIAQRRAGRDRIEVLIVEDDPFSRKLIENALKAQFSILFAPDGATALATYIKNAPDVVFLDIDLPDISGHDILKRIMDIDPKSYVVMLSGNGFPEHVIKAVNSGAKGFVGKPFAKEKLVQYINKCPKFKLETAGA